MNIFKSWFSTIVLLFVSLAIICLLFFLNYESIDFSKFSFYWWWGFILNTLLFTICNSIYLVIWHFSYESIFKSKVLFYLISFNIIYIPISMQYISNVHLFKNQILNDILILFILPFFLFVFLYFIVTVLLSFRRLRHPNRNP